jgi:hypothetical protein
LGEVTLRDIIDMTNKKLVFFIIIVAAFFGLSINSCKEVGPVLPWGNTGVLSDTTYTETPQAPETKNVLIEMFTGVQCINCPQGDAILAGLITQYPSTVIGIAMHSTKEPAALDDSMPDSKQFLGCADAQTIVSQFGDPGVRPMGSVNRISHISTLTNALSIYDDRSTWNGSTQTEFAKITPVNVVLSASYTPATQGVLAVITLHYNNAASTLPDSNKLSVFLTEDSIVTAQLDGNSNDTFYVHNWIMRKAISNPLGDIIYATTTPGTVTRLVYQYTIPSHSIWNPAHMHIVAFVQKYLNNQSDILQAKITPLIQ